MTATDIRAWGRDNGWDVSDRGPLPAELRSAYATAQAGQADQQEEGPRPAGSTSQPSHAPPAGPETAGPGDEGEPGPAEIPPRPPPRKPILERGRELLAGPKKASETTSRKPRVRRRVSLENLGSLVWGGLARAVTTAGMQYLPVSKMMAFQAPVAGAVFEEMARGTAADKLLQPVARLVESGSAAGTLIGLPLITAVTCRRPDIYPVARPLMASMMKEWVIVAGPKLRAMRAREEKFAAEMAQFGEEYGMSIEDMLDEIFTMPEEMLAQMGQPGGVNGQQPAA